ncbi:MAG: hypothetical protein EB127_05530 [Alphaproteobacteria bacterium]|nr:hypothetical protein [Alphaproteobacteria bacterium]
MHYINYIFKLANKFEESATSEQETNKPVALSNTIYVITSEDTNYGIGGGLQLHGYCINKKEAEDALNSIKESDAAKGLKGIYYSIEEVSKFTF